jgi:hypothetical protein
VISGPLESTSTVFGIGGDCSFGQNPLGRTQTYSGTVDDVRVYNRTLGATDVANLYDQGTAGAAQVGASSALLQNDTTLAQGLVGLWTFDGPDVTDKVYDRSSSGFNGYWGGISVGTSSAKTPGKLGQALNFEGTDGFVSIGNTGASIQTVSFWMKPGSMSDHKILDLDGGTHQIQTISSKVTATGFSGAYVDGVATSSLTLETTGWHFVVATTSSSFTASAMTIGKVGALFFLGKLDDVRLYNRLLTTNEINNLYKLGGVTISP